MPISKRRIQTILIHSGVWVLYIFINNLLLFLNADSYVSIRRTLFTYPLVAALFYINAHWIADLYIPKRQFGRLIFWSIILLGSYVLLRYLTFAFIFPNLNIQTDYQDVKLMFDRLTLDSVWIATQYLLFSYGYWFAYYQIKLQREKRHLAITITTLEKERMQAEIAFLQAQINPHFLYNTFNFLYSEAFFVSTRLADAILTLSTVMRSLTEMGKQAYLPIPRVLELIQNYLKLQRYRFGESLPFELIIEGEEYLDYVNIPPLVFITLVENIFKHGDLSDKTQPARVWFQLTENTLTYRSCNRKRDTIRLDSTGIGMPNLLKQLQLLYKDKFELNKEETADTYVINLVILDTSITS